MTLLTQKSALVFVVLIGLQVVGTAITIARSPLLQCTAKAMWSGSAMDCFLGGTRFVVVHVHRAGMLVVAVVLLLLNLLAAMVIVKLAETLFSSRAQANER